MINTIAVDRVTCTTARVSILFGGDDDVFTGHVFWILLKRDADIPVTMKEGKAIRDLVTGRRPERYLRYRSMISDSGCEPSNKRSIVEVQLVNLFDNNNYQIIVAALAPETTYEPAHHCTQFTQFKTLATPLVVSTPEFLFFEQPLTTATRSDFSFTSTGQGVLRYVVLSSHCYDLVMATDTFNLDQQKRPITEDEVSIRTLITMGGSLTVKSEGVHTLSIISKSIVSDRDYTLVLQSDQNNFKRVLEFDTTLDTKVVNYYYTTGSPTVEVTISESGLLWYAVIRASTALPWKLKGKELIELVKRSPTTGHNRLARGNDVLITGRVVVDGEKRAVIPVGDCEEEHLVLLILPTTRTKRWIESPTRVLLSSTTVQSIGKVSIKSPEVTKSPLMDQITLSFHLDRWAALGADCVTSFALLPLTSSIERTISTSEVLNPKKTYPGAVSVCVNTTGVGPHKAFFTTVIGISYKLFGVVNLVWNHLNISQPVINQSVAAIVKISTDRITDIKVRCRKERIPATKGAFVDSWREGRPRLRKNKLENPSKVVTVGRMQARGIYQKCDRGPWSTRTNRVVAPLIVEKHEVGTRHSNVRINSTEHALELKKVFCSFPLTERLNTSFVIHCKQCSRTERASTIRVMEIKRSTRGLVRFHNAYKRGLVATNSHRVLYRRPPLNVIPLESLHCWLELLGAGESNITSTPWDVSWPIFLVLCTFQEIDRPCLTELKSRYTSITSNENYHNRDQFIDLLSRLSTELSMSDRDASFSNSGFSDADFYRGFEFNFVEVVISLFFSRFDQLALLRARGRGTALDKNFQYHHMCLINNQTPVSPSITLSPGMVSVIESVGASQSDGSQSVSKEESSDVDYESNEIDPTIAFNKNVRGSLTRSALRNMNHVLAPESRRKSSTFIPVGKEFPLGIRKSSKDVRVA